jgi:hypothetical protein
MTNRENCRNSARSFVVFPSAKPRFLAVTTSAVEKGEIRMRYAYLIYSKEVPPEQVSEAEFGQVMAEYNAFTADVRGKGVYLGGEALQPTNTATTVRVRDGKPLMTDGPFAETKEALGGFYILECKDLNEALEWAQKLPGSKWGSVEVRPIVDFPAA